MAQELTGAASSNKDFRHGTFGVTRPDPKSMSFATTAAPLGRNLKLEVYIFAELPEPPKGVIALLACAAPRWRAVLCLWPIYALVRWNWSSTVLITPLVASTYTHRAPWRVGPAQRQRVPGK